MRKPSLGVDRTGARRKEGPQRLAPLADLGPERRPGIEPLPRSASRRRDGVLISVIRSPARRLSHAVDAAESRTVCAWRSLRRSSPLATRTAFIVAIVASSSCEGEALGFGLALRPPGP